MKGLIGEFKEFISRGNVIDLAVAVVIGGAFTAIVNSIVNDLIMPLISLCTGGVDFSEMKIVIGSGANAAAFTYGNLISAILQFLIIALVVFLIVKAMNKSRDLASKLKKGEEEAEPEYDILCPRCRMEVKEDATRCPHCTSEFEAPEKVLKEAAE